MAWNYVCLFSGLFLLISAVLGNTLLTSDVGLSARDCRLACINRVLCQAFTFRRHSTFCELYVSVLDEFTAGRKVPGLVYTERKDITEVDPFVHCNGSCSVDSTCESGCLKSECPSPSEESDITMIGNVRRSGSKVQVACKNFFQQPIIARCTEAGGWSPAQSCEVYNYDFHGPNTYGGMLLDGPDISILSMESDYLEQCLATCNETAFCGGVNFNPVTRNCTFRNAVMPWWRAAEAGWSYYSKTLPITFHKLNNVVYQFTFDEGMSFCETLGTSIATHADVVLAHTLGFNTCNCGWVSEGYSMISLHKDCGAAKKGVKMCWDALKFDLFCKNNKFTYHV